jgi:hypothetical protein
VCMCVCVCVLCVVCNCVVCTHGFVLVVAAVLAVLCELTFLGPPCSCAGLGVRTSKDVYSAGEDVIVKVATNLTEGRAWVGVYRSGGVPGTDLSEAWAYACGSKECTEEVMTGEVVIPSGSLGAGLYDVYYFYEDYTRMPGTDKVAIEVETGTSCWCVAGLVRAVLGCVWLCMECVCLCVCVCVCVCVCMCVCVCVCMCVCVCVCVCMCVCVCVLCVVCNCVVCNRFVLVVFLCLLCLVCLLCLLCCVS